MGDDEKCKQTLVRRLEGKKLLGSPRHRWKDNILKDFIEIW
jgi:hypothetical protein